MSSDGEEIMEGNFQKWKIKVKKEKWISGIPHDKELLILQNSMDEDSKDLSKISKVPDKLTKLKQTLEDNLPPPKTREVKLKQPKRISNTKSNKIFPTVESDAPVR